MRLGKELVLLVLMGIFMAESECKDDFNTDFSTGLLYVGESLSYVDSERKCEEEGAKLAEIWNEFEWEEVKVDGCVIFSVVKVQQFSLF